MAGPAWLAAAVPVSTKIPVPMMAPIPSKVRSTAVSARFRCLPCSTSLTMRSIDLVLSRFESIRPPTDVQAFLGNWRCTTEAERGAGALSRHHTRQGAGIIHGGTAEAADRVPGRTVGGGPRLRPRARREPPGPALPGPQMPHPQITGPPG